MPFRTDDLMRTFGGGRAGLRRPSDFTPLPFQGYTAQTQMELMPQQLQPHGGFRGGEQQLIGGEQEPDFLDKIGKAFSQFSKALATPGFQNMLAKMGMSLAAPGSMQERVGAAVAGVTAGQQQQAYLSKLLSGEPVTAQDVMGLTPEQLQQGRALQLTQERQAATRAYQEGIVEKYETPEERAEREQAGILLRAATRAPAAEKAPTVTKIPVGVGEEAGGYLTPDPTSPTGYTWTELGRGRKPEELREVPPGQQQGLYFRMHGELVKEVTRDMPEPDRMEQTAEGIIPIWASRELREEFAQKLTLLIAREQLAGRLSTPWMGVSSAAVIDQIVRSYKAKEAVLSKEELQREKRRVTAELRKIGVKP